MGRRSGVPRLHMPRTQGMRTGAGSRASLEVWLLIARPGCLPRSMKKETGFSLHYALVKELPSSLRDEEAGVGAAQPVVSLRSTTG